MKKLIIKLLLTTAILTTLTAPAFAQTTKTLATTSSTLAPTKNTAPTPKEVPTAKTIIKIDGKTIKPEVVPFVENGHLYVPISVAKNFGATVESDGTRCRIIRKDIITQFFYAKSEYALQINWQKIPNKPLAIRKPNQTFIPLKFVAETFNCDVKFDSTTNTYNITNKGLIKVELTKERYHDVKGYVYYADGTPAKNMEVFFIPMSADGGINAGAYYRKYKLKEIPSVKTDENGFYVFKNIDTDTFPFTQITVNKDGNGSNGDWYGLTPCEVDPDLLYNIPEVKGYPGIRINAKRIIMPNIYIIPNPFKQ
jgi:hypothetical protein